jgi:hypothetical protein
MEYLKAGIIGQLIVVILMIIGIGQQKEYSIEMFLLRIFY